MQIAHSVTHAHNRSTVHCLIGQLFDIHQGQVILLHTCTKTQPMFLPSICLNWIPTPLKSNSDKILKVNGAAVISNFKVKSRLLYTIGHQYSKQMTLLSTDTLFNMHSMRYDPWMNFRFQVLYILIVSRQLI